MTIRDLTIAYLLWMVELLHGIVLIMMEVVYMYMMALFSK